MERQERIHRAPVRRENTSFGHFLNLAGSRAIAVLNQFPAHLLSALLRGALALLAVSVLYACGGSGSSGGNAGDGGNPPPPPPPPPTGIAISAALQQGSYWEFAANTQTQSFAQGSGASTSSDYGTFRITLGAPTTIGSATLYPLSVTGKSKVGNFEFAPRWTHIGISAGSVLGSTNGSTVQTVYNGGNSSGAAAGFFVHFAANETVAATKATFTGQYNTLAAVRAGHSTSSGGCEVILGLTLCSDTSTSFSEREYYKDGIGPVGYVVDISYSSSGGGFYTSTTINRTVEIVGTSLAASDGAAIKPPPWTEVAPLAAARKNFSASAYNGEIYVFGGYNASNTNLTSVEIYNPASNAWRPGVAAPIGLANYKAKTVGSKTYLIGSGSAVRIFDHSTNTWSSGPVAPFSDPSFDIDVWADSAVGHTYVLVIASNLSAGRHDVFAYEVSLSPNQWYYGTSYPSTDHRWHAIAAIGDAVYLAGGYRQYMSSKVSGATYLYSPVTDIWTTSALGLLKLPRYDARAVNLNGTLVLLGGQTASLDALREVEAYDVTSKTWSMLPKMLRARNNFAAVVLGGKIYAIGGTSGSSTPLANVEAYTPY